MAQISLSPSASQTTKIGYARVSTDEQDTAIQEQALRAAGCERILAEQASGGRWDRPQLHTMLELLRPGDTVVVHRLDRLSRNLRDLLAILEKLETAGAKFQSLSEAIDTGTPAGAATLQMAGVLAEFERSIIRERTFAGLRLAKSKGKHCGRPSKLSQEQKAEVHRLVTSGQKSQAECARQFNVDPATVCRIVHSQPTQTKHTKKSKRDRVGINAGHRTKPREGSSSDDRRSSGDAPVNSQQAGGRNDSAAHASLASGVAPQRRDGSKEPPPCPKPKASSEH